MQTIVSRFNKMGTSQKKRLWQLAKADQEWLGHLAPTFFSSCGLQWMLHAKRPSIFLLYPFHLLSPLANSIVFPFSVANLGPSNCSSELISECITSMKLTIHHYVPSYVTSFLVFPTTIYFITSFPFTLALPGDNAHLCEVWWAFWSWKVNFLG